MIDEVRRQFREMPGILEGTTTPDYTKCVEISTQAALKEMVIPAAIHPAGRLPYFFPDKA